MFPKQYPKAGKADVLKEKCKLSKKFKKMNLDETKKIPCKNKIMQRQLTDEIGNIGIRTISCHEYWSKDEQMAQQDCFKNVSWLFNFLTVTMTSHT